ncbi:hypothetical protein GOARA_021_00450 [Gordonia araii NBRC 100433]|uniref:Uncharacterized protein n=1 Tax=Gordonia araii NBRC 100433 TaxID=1073574 RepID=G7GYY3_9ACTN|nr:hypothetical protein [Gordonia araii]NNG97018.1 hypothetical protein [Gordonia araii NBRC 100433]GAB08808.1 hypothetical protein GOARA_021_00450 [Gordonia araii NBRC 100433]
MLVRANSLFAGIASFVLGTGAHTAAGAVSPDARQLTLLAMIAGVVSMIRAGHAIAEQREHSTGRLTSSWKSVVLVLVGGQLAAHIVLSVLAAPGGHHDVSSLAMVGWHAAAMPAAAVLLVSASWLLRVLTSTLRVIGRPTRLGANPTRPAVPTRKDHALHGLAPQLSVGRRAPPLVG